MNKTLKLVSLIAAAAVVAGCGTLGQAGPRNGYAQSPNAAVVKDPFGLCWRTGYWTAADATEECDPTLVPKKEVPPPAPAPCSGSCACSGTGCHARSGACPGPGPRACRTEV